jgi:NAD(P)-dependent dehydrogenase (short-subunit alcohol dehydrogenase family)
MKRMHTYIVTGGNTGLGYQCARFLGADPNTLISVAAATGGRNLTARHGDGLVVEYFEAVKKAGKIMKALQLVPTIPKR